MESNYSKLEVSKNSTLDEVKKAYLKKVRKFPPEENPEKFIEIRKAYEEILRYRNDEKYEIDLIKRYFKMMRFSINNKNEKEVNEYCNKIKELISVETFKVVSDELVDLIIYSKNLGNKSITLSLTEIFSDDFKRLGLTKLNDRYSFFKDVLKEGFRANGN